MDGVASIKCGGIQVWNFRAMVVWCRCDSPGLAFRTGVFPSLLVVQTFLDASHSLRFWRHTDFLPLIFVHRSDYSY